MSGQFRLTNAQIERLWPFLPHSSRKQRIDGRWVPSGIIVGPGFCRPTRDMMPTGLAMPPKIRDCGLHPGRARAD
jgi:hypothetical protein